ncbi:MAG: carboxypeptidase regulatory-like domain-containing protein [Chloracidobacterium sp.]|nr:carboxypeptidase regulatory-like domain-containing protein [Chloracidobacterium sp.]
MYARPLLLAGTPALIAVLIALVAHGTSRSAHTSGISAPEVRRAAASGVSKRADSLTAGPLGERGRLTVRSSELITPHSGETQTKHDADASPARLFGAPMPTPSLIFDGISNYDNINAYGMVFLPPDMNGDVGPNHYVQVANALVKIFDKNGNTVSGPFRLSSLFSGLGTVCSTRDDGLPTVLYDPLADRWMLSQYCNAFPPFRQMIAVSKTGDPTGEYFVYEFVMPNIRINDFARFGVWPDGYYMSTEEFLGSDYAGQGMFAFEREKMLKGDPTASYIYFSRRSLSAERLGNILPSDLDGLRPPPAGAPNVFASYSATEYGEAADALRLFDLHADWADPFASTFTERPESPIAVAAFDPTSPPGRADIAQPPPGEMLDSNSDRLNSRLAYRNFGTSESLIVDQTVRMSPGGTYRAGVRIHELRRSGGNYTVNVDSTLGTADASRWIGSAAQDGHGNIAFGYSYGSENKKPAILYSGRLTGDPAGSFREEGSLAVGTGVQKAYGFRWGDWSSMSVDPSDDCTFWQTGEYFTQQSQDFSDFTWLTRIGRYKFDECTAAPRSWLTGTVLRADNGAPISGALIRADLYSRSSAADGNYGSMMMLPGSYSVAASAPGFRTRTVTMSIADGESRTLDFALEPIAVFSEPQLNISAESCGISNAPDPGEAVTIDLTLTNSGNAPVQNLVATLLAGGGVTLPGAAQAFGPMPVGGPAVTRPFTFTVSPTLVCGEMIEMTFHLQDGSNDLGSITVSMRTGTPKVAFTQNFDRTQQSTLPPRWTRSETHATEFETPGERNWHVSLARGTNGTRSAYARDIQYVGVNEMTSPVFLIGTPSAKLSFRNWYELETTFLRNRLYDGSVLEIKIGNSDWEDIIAAGGVFESGGYDGTIDTCCQNPLGGRPGWSGRSGIEQTSQFIDSVVRLPAAAAGQMVQLRWRLGTDIGTFREGQYIDDIAVTDGYVCGCTN